MDLKEVVGALTIYGEARGEGFPGMSAVAHVIRNRLVLGSWGKDIVSVCFAPWQFSCWNAGDPNRALLVFITLDDEQIGNAIQIWRQAAFGVDVTYSATHYLNLEWCQANNKVPDWVAKATKTVEIGHHTFYKDVP